MKKSQINNSAPAPEKLDSGDFAGASQIGALAEPTRLAIYSAVAWGGARTVREVAARLGRNPGSLYRHFDVLVGMGVLVQDGTVATSRRAAKTYRAQRDARFVYRPDDVAAIDALNRAVWSAARNAARGFGLATKQGRATTHGPARDTYMGTQSGWLTAAQLATFNGMLDAQRAFLLERDRQPGARLIELTAVMSPLMTDDETEG